LGEGKALSEPATIGGFELREIVGRGSFGTVFKAWDTRLSRTVAIKVPRSDCPFGREDLERFLREGRTAARLSHPAILQVYAADRDGGIPFLVREFVPGRTLAEAIRTRPFTPAEASRIVITVADALEYAHSRRVFHRDVKPSNILLTADGTPYLADF